LRIRFTMLVLQKAAARRQSSAIDVISSFASVAAPQYSMISSQVAKLLQGILRAQPDIKFFDFDMTFFSDKPEGLVAIVPAGATPAGPQPAGPPVGPQPAGPPLGPPPAGPSGSFQPAPGIDTVHWLRYGRYALVETKPYNRRTTLIDLQTLKPSDISSDDAWLRIPSNAPLDSSYIVFRVLPGQLAESNDVLRAASDANVKLLDSLRRSDAEINAALEEIKTSATNLQDQVLRSRAESIAYKVFRDAQANKETDCKKIGDRFDNTSGVMKPSRSPMRPARRPPRRSTTGELNFRPSSSYLFALESGDVRELLRGGLDGGAGFQQHGG
jgi:hypothetical protein